MTVVLIWFCVWSVLKLIDPAEKGTIRLVVIIGLVVGLLVAFGVVHIPGHAG